jgi:hypothetical protein
LDDATSAKGEEESKMNIKSLQGVGDTRSQIYSCDGQGYGQGNRGQRGVTEVTNLDLSGN